MSEKYVKIDMKKCIGCGACVKKCKKGALSMGPDGFPIVDRALCTGCGKCKKVCPAECIKIKKDKDKDKDKKKDKEKKKDKKKDKKPEKQWDIY